MSTSQQAQRVDVLRSGHERARCGAWRGDPAVASLSPVADAPVPSEAFVRHCLSVLSDRGIFRVVTSALTPSEQAGFLAAGFAVEEQLHLLGVRLGPDLPAVPAGLPIERPGRRRRPDVLAVDHAAFSPFWRFDDRSLLDALAATPRTRYRVAVDAGGRIRGYAICGRAGAKGFVQRLAVDPAAQHGGIGRRLLLDGLHWLHRRGAARAVVNTQLDNLAALSLYRATGFVDQPSGLSVLSITLPHPQPPWS